MEALMAEAAVVAAVMRLLAKRGAWHFNLHGSGMGRNGLPDIHAVYRGRALAIETKSKTGQLRPLQRWELQQARLAGAHTIVARSVDDVAQVLDRIDLIESIEHVQ